jgi:hypothetical protein
MKDLVDKKWTVHYEVGVSLRNDVKKIFINIWIFLWRKNVNRDVLGKRI